MNRVRRSEGTIVVVDDDDVRRYTKARVLRDAGFEAVEARTGEEGLQRIRAFRPRLAIVDVGLPDMSGHEVCRRIKADPELSTLPVLQISATFVSEEDTIASLDSGADASLIEPIVPQVMVATVRALIRARFADEATREALAREQAARAAAEDANRVKDEFLAVLSHELRSPLGAILSWATLLRDGRLDAERREQGLAAIERNARLQTKLIEDLLDVSRIISGKTVLEVSLVEIGPAIEAALHSVRVAAEAKEIRLESSVEPGLGPLRADATRLQQVIWNLLSNAIKFTPRGGLVRVEARALDSRAEIRVLDTGKGIDPSFRPHVFDRFRQADSSTTRSEGGLGLGLAIVRHIVELHGGTVLAESDGPGKGSTFIVSFPLPAVRDEVIVPALAGERRARPGAVAFERLDGLRVLVVDDEADSRDAVTATLESCGADVVAAGGVAGALEALDGTPFDVLISDIGMPGEDGYALLRRLRENGWHPRMPALALTAYANASEMGKIHAAGFAAVLSKPVDARDLVAEVKGLAEKRT